LLVQTWTERFHGLFGYWDNDATAGTLPKSTTVGRGVPPVPPARAEDDTLAVIAKPRMVVAPMMVKRRRALIPLLLNVRDLTCACAKWPVFASNWNIIT